MFLYILQEDGTGKVERSAELISHYQLIRILRIKFLKLSVRLFLGARGIYTFLACFYPEKKQRRFLLESPTSISYKYNFPFPFLLLGKVAQGSNVLTQKAVGGDQSDSNSALFLN